MSRAPLVLSLLLLVYGTAAAATGVPPVPDPPGPKEKWLSVDAGDFEIISSVSPSQTMEIARELLRMREAVGQITRLNVKTSGRIKVFVFDGDRKFAPFRDAAFQRKMENTTGGYFGSDDGHFIILESEAGRDIDRTVYHELTHYFARNTAPSLPLWFNEGLAEFYSTFKTSGTEVLIGRPVAEHVQWLRSQPLIPLKELLATTTESPIYNEGVRTGVFYAQSWALVHYLMTGSAAQRASLGKFLNAVAAGKAVDDAFTSAFGITYAQLENELRVYVHRYSFQYTKYALSASSVREPESAVPMSRDALLYELGHFYTWTGNQGAAEQFLTAALANNPNHAGALADAGRVHELAGRHADADAAYAKAIALGSSDARVHLEYGLMILERLSGIVDKKGESQMLAARQAFQRSVELDPTNARAWTALGATYVPLPGDHTAGIAALEKSLDLEPGDARAAFYLLQLYADAGRGEEAARLFPIVARDPDRQMASMAGRSLVVAEVRRSEALARDGKFEEAIPIAEAALAKANDPQLQQYLQSFLAEIRRMAANDIVVTSMNRAIARANAGKPAEALAIVEEVIPRITDPEMLARAKQFRSELAARVKNR